jgi:hypothetical protein
LARRQVPVKQLALCGDTNLCRLPKPAMVIGVAGGSTISYWYLYSMIYSTLYSKSATPCYPMAHEPPISHPVSKVAANEIPGFFCPNLDQAIGSQRLERIDHAGINRRR